MAKNRGAFNASRRGYRSSFFCSICNLPPQEQKYTPIKQWAQENNYSIDQCRTLLRKGYLLGFQFKNRMYVMENPQWQRNH